jgi:hypothetical protein
VLSFQKQFKGKGEMLLKCVTNFFELTILLSFLLFLNISEDMWVSKIGKL